MRCSIGAVEALPDGRCVALAEGRAVAVRVGDEVYAFRNECPHEGSSLEGGWVRDGVLSCPSHFWRFDLADGACRNAADRLDAYPVSVDHGEAYVDLPELVEPAPLRERLLARARTYDRARAWRDRSK